MYICFKLIYVYTLTAYLLEFTQAVSLILGFKEIIEKQNIEIQNLQNINCSLKKENKVLSDKNSNLLEKIKKVEKESNVKNSQLVKFIMYYILFYFNPFINYLKK